MKILFNLILCTLIFHQICAQNPGDTIVVQTFDYNMTYGNAWDGTVRDTTAYFPNNPNLTFEKIIMAYSMRCRNGQVNTSGGNSVGCGEWDYSCHTYIHDSTRIDSILHKTSSHSIIGFNGSNYTYTTSEVYNYFWVADSIGNLYIDSILSSPDTIVSFGVVAFPGTLNSDIVDTLSSIIAWEPYSYTYDTLGNVINVDTLSIDGTINISELIYYKRYPMAFQIMSFVTPYGIGLDLGPEGKTWYFDVTDYIPVLKGPKRITVSGGGQWQEDMDIKFYFIVGTPTRDVIDIRQIWRPQSKSYTSIIANNSFEARDILMNPNANAYKVKTTITGHGQEGEFIPQNHTLNIDGGALEYTWPVWTECSENPIFPQGGTWIYDRAGWCPGQASDIKEHDITLLVSSGQLHNIDYGLTNATGSSNYWVSSQLVSYGMPNHSLDAAIVDIISPTKNIIHARKNPLCSKPKIKIQNTGSSTLYSLQINYWINNASIPETYLWNGSLEFLETEIIDLPDPNSLWSNIANNNTFNVEITSPNNSSDEYLLNNSMSSIFEPAPTYPGTFTLWFQTNNGVISSASQISESSWEFFDNSGGLVYSSGNLPPNTQFRDTLTFNNGCYIFKVTDTDDDGLDFWANNDGGGMTRFREIGGGWLQNFDGDFGRSIYHEFRVEETSSVLEKNNSIQIFPNPVKDEITVIGNLNPLSKIILKDKLGRVVKITHANNVISHKIDISSLANGVYFLSANNKAIKKIVKQ